MLNPDLHYSPSMDMLMGRIGEAIREDPAFGDAPSIDAKCTIAGRANVQHALENLVSLSEIIRTTVSEARLELIGAEYDMVSGVVHWMR